MAKTQTVRGTHDLLNEDQVRHSHIITLAREVSERFGFSEVSTPIFEFTDVFSRTLGDSSDIVNKEMYTFEDRGGESITLRPEGTAGIARAVIQHGQSRNAPLKYFYQGPMFRYERPQKGRQRQFNQIGVENIGTASSIADIEIISLANIFLKELGLTDSVSLEINSIGDSESRKKYRAELVNYFKVHKGSLGEDSQKRLETNPLRILDSKEKSEQKIIAEAPTLEEFLNTESKEMFSEIREGLDSIGISYDINPRLVRGLDYYCHCVFEFRTQELGAQDAVLAGGRYDPLIKLMGGPDIPGVGWAAGIERLALLMKSTPEKTRPIALIPIGEVAEKKALSLAHELRSKGFVIEMPYSGNLGKRMKKADKAGATQAIIFGEEEVNKSIFTVKTLSTGDQIQVPLDQLEATLKPV